MAVVAVVLGIVAALPPLAHSIKWVGRTDLEVQFVIIDASTGQPVPNANVFVRAEPGTLYESNDSREFTITTNNIGQAKHLCRNRRSWGSESAFEDTFAVELPSWWFHVTATGYVDTAPAYLDALENRRAVKRGTSIATIEVRIPLQKAPR
jgi:hypothetical protein